MTRTFSNWVAIACPIALALFTGCSHASAPPKVPEGADPSATNQQRKADAASTRPESMVHVSSDILSACQIHDEPAGTTPEFAFDSASLSASDQHLLQEVAHCLTAGPLGGRSLKLVGRADPRGTEDYNMHLGDRRASTVQHFLERQGMTATRISESSRGALDASGTDESTWRNDRRVDVDLAM